jgi:choline dehydrogenase-like flavoprotein
MLIDARALPANEVLRANVCIVGAGAAGISLAMEFAGAQFSVLLLEGGGLGFEHSSQFLNCGQSRGRAFPPLENTRRRQFGGTTAVWFGRCRALDAIDFQSRPSFPNNGWPFSRDELEPFTLRALDLCQIESDDSRMQRDVFTAAGLESKLFHFSPPTHFGQAYLPRLRAAANLRLVLHTNVTEIELDPGGGTVTRLLCATLGGRRFSIAARFFILATGGLENPRLLLNSRKVHPSGIANSGDLVGRYFMEHIYAFPAAVTAFPAGFPPEYMRLNYDSFQRHIAPTLAIGLPESVMREQGLPNAAAFFVRRPVHKTDDRFYSRKMRGFISLMEVLRHRRAHSRQLIGYARETIVNAGTVLALMGKAAKARLSGLGEYALHLQMEPVPNRESRITLVDSRDALGVNQICVEWRLTSQDLEGLQRFVDLILRGLASFGLQTRLIHHERDEEGWPVFMPSSRHHMGTTRMSRNPRSGIVDQDCRVHGIGNLYLAGSSVFPSAGMANPTLTIIALAVRLADHLKRVLS